MKIVFLCSCLEPGRDGIGDYTRRLAIELIRQGNFAMAVSLNDKFISEKFDGVQQSEGCDLPILRLPGSWPINDRISHAKKYIDAFDPGWLSLQFGVFGFHPKGLPFKLGDKLAHLGAGRRWHMMFHELWLGMEVQSSKKHAIWGRVQRMVIKTLISKLKPKVIQTHTTLYMNHLKKLGFTSQRLPLFSNIPNTCKNGQKLNSIKPFQIGKSINFILFGNIHPNAPVEDFIEDILMYSAKSGIKMELSIIGRCGIDQKRWADKWAAAGMDVNIYGEQPADGISEALGAASVGISTTPAALIEKSGAVAAMLEHGLPVICIPFSWDPKTFTDLNLSPGIMLYKKRNLDSIFDGEFVRPAKNDVSVVARQLVSTLVST